MKSRGTPPSSDQLWRGTVGQLDKLRSLVPEEELSEVVRGRRTGWLTSDLEPAEGTPPSVAFHLWHERRDGRKLATVLGYRAGVLAVAKYVRDQDDPTRWNGQRTAYVYTDPTGLLPHVLSPSTAGRALGVFRSDMLPLDNIDPESHPTLGVPGLPDELDRALSPQALFTHHGKNLSPQPSAENLILFGRQLTEAVQVLSGR